MLAPMQLCGRSIQFSGASCVFPTPGNPLHADQRGEHKDWSCTIDPQICSQALCFFPHSSCCYCVCIFFRTEKKCGVFAPKIRHFFAKEPGGDWVAPTHRSSFARKVPYLTPIFGSPPLPTRRRVTPPSPLWVGSGRTPRVLKEASQTGGAGGAPGSGRRGTRCWSPATTSMPSAP